MPIAHADKATRFAQLHRKSAAFVMPNPWDAGSALILAELGFEALVTSSAAGAMALGRRDGEITRDEALAHAEVALTIHLAGEASLCGGSIEDASGDPARPLYDFAHAVERVAAAAEAARAHPFPFTLTARTENYLRGKPDLDDTILRLQAFEKAGADVLFAPALPDLAAVRRVCASLTKPVNFMNSIEGKSQRGRAGGGRRAAREPRDVVVPRGDGGAADGGARGEGRRHLRLSGPAVSARTVKKLAAAALTAVLLAVSTGSSAAPTGAVATESGYETVRASPDGIGKRYMGREIAQVMGWQGAAWLEREEREREERTDLLLPELALVPGMVVADIGAGTGYIARRMALQVGAQGGVYAVDVQPEMIGMLQSLATKAGLAQIRPVLGSESDVRLPAASVDLAIMVDVYHELAYPREVLASIVRALKPGGRVVFVEYRAEDPRVPIKALHKMSEAQVRREAGASGLVWERTAGGLPWQHAVIFRKR